MRAAIEASTVRDIPGTSRAARTIALSLAYLLVWATTGIPAFWLAEVAETLTAHHPGLATGAAVTALAAAGLYQLTPLTQNHGGRRHKGRRLRASP